DLRSGQVTSTSVVRYRGNDYSVPTAFGHREVWIKGFVDRVVIGCAAEAIAEHIRSYEKDDITYNPVHYLRLIERKIMAFDQAAPLQDWDLPDAFATLQRLLEARQGKTGKREYVQVLRLMERFEQNVLHDAVRDALQMGAISFDAVKHLVLCRMERRAPRLDLDLYPFLPRTNITTTSATTYMSLLTGDAP
ncbi:Mu transposase domain-containing protein, partial [Yoonia sp.]|uniref:Mu transposase domain-containing protein n=1 Tax=Yoonia sp. TaxID=2212373 RepID=UPI0023A0B4A4|nr:IS21 family transposase [Yoonia sp.]